MFCVHSIAGRIIAEPENLAKKRGKISASLVQFGEALDHGISAEGSETASQVTSQNTGNIFSTRKLAIRKKKYKMSSKW